MGRPTFWVNTNKQPHTLMLELFLLLLLLLLLLLIGICKTSRLTPESHPSATQVPPEGHLSATRTHMIGLNFGAPSKGEVTDVGQLFGVAMALGNVASVSPAIVQPKLMHASRGWHLATWWERTAIFGLPSTVGATFLMGWQW